MNSREQFEAWAEKLGFVTLKVFIPLDDSDSVENTVYTDGQTRLAWETWQARESSMYDMTKVYNDVAALLPDSRYIDPPDGGDVEIAEQIRRMIADKVREAFIKGAKLSNDVYQSDEQIEKRAAAESYDVYISVGGNLV